MARTLVGNVAFSGNEHDGTMKAAGGGQRALKLQTIKTGHRNIQTAQPGTVTSCSSRNSCGEEYGSDLISPGAEQSRQRLEDSGVIIDKINCELVRHAVPNVGCWNGNENPAMAPPRSSLTRVSFP